MLLATVIFVALTPWVLAGTEFDMAVFIPNTENLDSTVQFTCTWNPADVDSTDFSVGWSIKATSVNMDVSMKARPKSQWPKAGPIEVTVLPEDPDLGNVTLDSERRFCNLTLRKLPSQGVYTCTITSTHLGVGERLSIEMVTKNATIAMRVDNRVPFYTPGKPGFIRLDPKVFVCFDGPRYSMRAPWYLGRSLDSSSMDSLIFGGSYLKTQGTGSLDPKCIDARSYDINVVYYKSLVQTFYD